MNRRLIDQAFETDFVTLLAGFHVALVALGIGFIVVFDLSMCVPVAE